MGVFEKVNPSRQLNLCEYLVGERLNIFFNGFSARRLWFLRRLGFWWRRFPILWLQKLPQLIQRIGHYTFIVEPDKDILLQNIIVKDLAGAVWSLDLAVDLGHTFDEIFVYCMFILQAAHEASAYP